MSDEKTSQLMLSPLGWESTPGAVLTVADCGHEAWISQSGMNFVADPETETTTICLNCVIKDHPEEILKILSGTGAMAVPGTLEEIADDLGQEVSDDIKNNFNVKEYGEESGTT